MYQVITSDFAKVNVTNSQNDAVAFEKKFAKTLSIEELKVMCVYTTVCVTLKPCHMIYKT